MFYEKELNFRRLMRYPPFSALASVLVRARQQEDAVRMSAELGRILSPPPENTKVIGPADAPVPRVIGESRSQMHIKATSRKRHGEVLRDLRRFAEKERWPATALVIDVDPLALL